jgi:hypothetical protein
VIIKRMGEEEDNKVGAVAPYMRNQRGVTTTFASPMVTTSMCGSFFLCTQLRRIASQEVLVLPRKQIVGEYPGKKITRREEVGQRRVHMCGGGLRRVEQQKYVGKKAPLSDQ